MNPTQGDQPISWLMFFTFAATIFIIAGGFAYFLRSRHNREIAADALAGDNSKTGSVPNGAGMELIAFAVFALIIMGLLTAGYRQSSYRVAQLPQTVGGRMAQPVGLADQPKVYQPANPAPDTRSAPASSSAGVGPDNGGRPENETK